jgi:hypothetical protein
MGVIRRVGAMRRHRVRTLRPRTRIPSLSSSPSRPRKLTLRPILADTRRPRSRTRRARSKPRVLLLVSTSRRGPCRAGLRVPQGVETRRACGVGRRGGVRRRRRVRRVARRASCGRSIGGLRSGLRGPGERRGCSHSRLRQHHNLSIPKAKEETHLDHPVSHQPHSPTANTSTSCSSSPIPQPLSGHAGQQRRVAGRARGLRGQRLAGRGL